MHVTVFMKKQREREKQSLKITDINYILSFRIILTVLQRSNEGLYMYIDEAHFGFI